MEPMCNECGDSKIVIATWVLVVVSFCVPFLVQKIQERSQSKRVQSDRREAIFRALMTYRANNLSHSFIDALNSVAMDFTGRKFRYVIRALRSYIEHTYTTGEPVKWEEKRQESLSTMLIAMSESLGYDFDDTNIKRDVYYPMVLSQDQSMRNAIDYAMKNGLLKDGVLNIKLVTEQTNQAVQEPNKE